MGNQICTQAIASREGYSSSADDAEKHMAFKQINLVDDQLLEEYDNPCRGLRDYSFLKTQIEASNQRMVTSRRERSQTLEPCLQNDRVFIDRTYTPSQPISFFSFDSDCTADKQWSELVYCLSESQSQKQPQDKVNTRQRKASLESALPELQARSLSSKQDQQTTSTILRQLSDFILSQKNMQQPMSIDKGNLIKVRSEEVKNHYIFLQKIGEGAYGNVFKAIHKGSRQLRAIKLLKKRMMSANDNEKVVNQIDILKKLDHPNIIKIYQVFVHGNNYYLVTEFCEGGSLSQALRERVLTIQNVRMIMGQLASVLVYMHGRGVAHRDIKLDNIMLSSKVGSQLQVSIKLIDFGLSKEINGRKIRDRQKIGTYTYMAPQVLQGLYSYKCDIWSAGIVFYYLVTCNHPFKAKTREETYERILNDNPKMAGQRWRQVGSNGRDLALGLLQKKHKHRMNAQQMLNHPWLKAKQPGSDDQEYKSRAVRKICDYHRGNSLVSMIEAYLSYTFSTQKQLREASQMFRLLDQNSDGFIEKSEIKKAFELADKCLLAEEIAYVLQTVDTRNQGKINYSQFVTMLSDRSKLFARQSLVQAFEFLDTDKNGFLQKKQLRSALKGCQQFNSIIEDLDANSDQRVSLDEFIRYMQG